MKLSDSVSDWKSRRIELGIVENTNVLFGKTYRDVEPRVHRVRNSVGPLRTALVTVEHVGLIQLGKAAKKCKHILFKKKVNLIEVQFDFLGRNSKTVCASQHLPLRNSKNRKLIFRFFFF